MYISDIKYRIPNKIFNLKWQKPCTIPKEWMAECESISIFRCPTL